MRFLSVCSGIEAASVAWAPLGWRAHAFAEIEPFPCAVLAHHYPDTPNWGDMTKFEDWPDAAIDLLVGGTPCQSFSVAGLRKGLDDARGNLMLVYAAIARKYRPRWLVWENVPGVISSNEGRDFASLLGLLSGQRIEVPKGGWQTAGVVDGYARAYGLAWRVLDAQFVRVDGYPRAVPQRRRRVFVVGYLGDWRRAAAVLFERDSLSGDPAPRREAGKGVAPTLAARTKGGGGLGTDFDCDGGLIAFGGNNTSGPIDVATAQTAHGGSGRFDFESETFVAHALRGEGFDASEDGTGRGTPLVPICFSAKDHGADAMSDLSPTLRAGGHSQSHANAGVMPAIAYRTTGNDGCYETGDVAPCLNTGSDPNHTVLAYDLRGREGGAQFEGPHETANIRAASGGSSRSYVQQQWLVRRLVPAECESLQGFPRGYTAIPYRGKPAADGPRYKALGNSYAVNVVRWIGRRITLVDEIGGAA